MIPGVLEFRWQGTVGFDSIGQFIKDEDETPKRFRLAISSSRSTKRGMSPLLSTVVS
jgi:hypothetical protein